MPDDKDTLNLREQIARIDKMQASIQSKQASIENAGLDAWLKRQEITFAPWKFLLAAIITAISLMAAGAGLLAAGVALAKLLS